MDEVTVRSVHLDSHEPGSRRLPGGGGECGDEVLHLADLQGPRLPADVDERRYRRGGHGVPAYNLRAHLAAAMAELETRRSAVGRYGGGQRGESFGRVVAPHPRNLPLDPTLRRNRPEGHYRHPHIVGASCEILDQVLCGKPGPEPESGRHGRQHYPVRQLEGSEAPRRKQGWIGVLSRLH